MLLEDGIYGLLSTAGALTALQGARVYPILKPETAQVPCTTYQTAGGNSTPGLGTSGPQRVRLQLDHYAADARVGFVLRNATRAVLEGFKGTLPNGFAVTAVQWLQPIDHYDNDAREFRCAAEYYVFFNVQ